MWLKHISSRWRQSPRASQAVLLELILLLYVVILVSAMLPCHPHCRFNIFLHLPPHRLEIGSVAILQAPLSTTVQSVSIAVDAAAIDIGVVESRSRRVRMPSQRMAETLSNPLLAGMGYGCVDAVSDYSVPSC